MLEVVFSDSAKGSLKVAKSYKKENVIGGAAIGYIGEKPSEVELEEQFDGKPIGGNSQDVVCIGFNLDIGDISNGFESVKRKEEFVHLFANTGYEKSEIEKFFELQHKDFDKMIAFAKEKQPIRIWKSNSPYSACGFTFVCNALKNINCKLISITLPDFFKTSDKSFETFTDWAEIYPSQFYKFLALEKEVSNIEKLLQSDVWEYLKAENSPLRAMVNGKLISVPADFYDHLIFKNLPLEEFVMARLIGEIMGKYPLGVSDGWYAQRIEKMIEDGRLTVVDNKNSSHPYSKILKIANQ